MSAAADAKRAASRTLTDIGDELNRACDLVECCFYAAGGVGDADQSSALQTVLNLASKKIRALMLELYAIDRAG